MSTLNNFDVNELILQLHGELKFAFEVANSTGKQAGMQLNQLKVKFGKKNLSDMGDDDTRILLNSHRYPSDEDWELELDYKYGDPIRDLPISQNWTAGETSQLVLGRLADVGVENIKGVSHIWNERLNRAGLSNIKQLALVSDEVIQEMCRVYGSLKPLEFQTKVLLLVRNFNPLQYSQFHSYPLLILLNRSTNELKKLFLDKLSGPQISDLRAMASVINLCLDKKLCKKLKISLLSNVDE